MLNPHNRYDAIFIGEGSCEYTKPYALSSLKMWLGILRTAPVRCTSPVPKHQYLESQFVLCSVFGCGSTGIANLVNPEDSLFGFNDSCQLFAFCEAAALEPLDPLCQLGQAAKPGELLLEFIERPC